MSQWFDMWSVENPAERPKLQRPGLQQSIKIILRVVTEEESLVPRERIFLAGISQGFATAIAAFFADTPKRFAGLIGPRSWTPAVSLLTEDSEGFEATENIEIPTTYVQSPRPVVIESGYGTPIFLSRSTDDDVVPIKNGRELRDILQSQRLEVEWREYQDGRH
ncbi:hypothetical protein EKO27_g8460 [Xylaria grammica]|uniref:Peptidase S9 prolyl oligopeptidase catalytic domain-containing protein n=1 Tax=Xylaria grammica TaxID=363999 RepID=A0A439CWZ7_9PEZI|nr:hypothetical protein EKO27_g8460 [Xylaria grammica]